MSRRASGIILFRRRGGLEVYLGRRPAGHRLLGGYHGFFILEQRGGDESLVAREEAAGDDDLRARLGCAARALITLAGILPVRKSRPMALDLGRMRALAASARAQDLTKELEAAGLTLATAGFHRGPRRIQPHCFRSPLDVEWFLREVESGAPVLPAGPGEVEESRWWRPSDALDAWRRGEILLDPDAVDFLRILEREMRADALERIDEPADFAASDRVLSWLPNIDVLPLHAPPLPASLPCNVFLAGTRRFVIVDPGPRKEASRRRLMSAVERRLSAGDRLEAVVLTHHHHDHVGALDEVVERFGAPVWAHAITGRLIQRDLDRALDDGDEIDLGDAPDGSGRQALRCIFTPGHAEGHLALHETRYGALIAGDLVSTLVGMYVGSPGGHLATYFESIERVRRLGARLLFPSHGIPTLAPDDLLERTLEHARRQLDSAREQLTAAPLSVAELARRLHDESRPELRPMYERSTRARLEHLAERGEALRVGEDLYVRGGPVGDESG